MSHPRTYRAPDDKRLAELQRIAGDVEMPPAYPEELAEFLVQYRQSDKLPATEFAKLNAKPVKDTFRMFPAKCRRALSYASPDARQVFWVLWDQHENRHGMANGLLLGSLDWLMEQTGIGRRNDVADAILELEVRGLVRILRSRGGRGAANANCFLLTCFADCLGNPPTADYETKGLPSERVTANDPETQGLEARQIAARFNARISATVELIRYTRRAKLRIPLAS